MDVEGEADSGETSRNTRTRAARTPEGHETLAGSEERFRSLVQNSSDVVTLVDAELSICYQTPSIERVLGYAPDELIGRTLTELVHPEDRLRVLAFLTEAGVSAGVTAPVEWRMRHRDGAWLHLETIANNLIADANVAHLVLNTRDISERKALERQLAHQAFHDPLTDLANRALFKNRVERAVARRTRDGSSFAVLFLDLDDFKKVNDSLGHVVGDELLVTAAARLRSCLRPGDTAARLGGDEFAVLLEDAPTVSDAAVVAERIIRALQAPVTLQGKETLIRTSVGIAMAELGDGADELLRNADIAMYMAKGAGKGCSAVFEATMHAAALERLELESDLRRAVELEEFVLHYQPIVALATGDIVGLEALVRWNHPERGLLFPAEFVALAEDTGLILPIGRWVAREACAEAARLQALRPDARPLVISINLSARQLGNASVVDEIGHAIEEAGVDPSVLMLEITETSMMHEGDETTATLRQLRALGVQLSIDDFGTGYSSLRYLQSYPVDMLKIAKPFTDGLCDDPQKAVFTRTIIELCRSLGLRPLAEGIECAEQAHELRRLGCELGQGNHLAKPLEASVVAALLAGGARLTAYVAEVQGGAKRHELDWWEKVLGRRTTPPGVPSPGSPA